MSDLCGILRCRWPSDHHQWNLADVGLVRMTKLLLAFCALLMLFVAVGCSAMGGEVSADQQKAKKDALQQFADKQPGPQRDPSRGR